MPADAFEWIYLAGLLAAEAIRFAYRTLAAREEPAWPLGSLLDALAFLGRAAVPLVYVLTPWLDAVNEPLPATLNWTGAAALAGVPILLWRAYADLGRGEESPGPVVSRSFVARGVYRYVRHPVYTALWLLGIAQALLLPNWIAGLAGLAGLMPLYLNRVPRDEELMLTRFGDEYRAYVERTGSVFPRLRR